MPRSLRTFAIALTVLALATGAATAAPPAGLKGGGADADKWVMDNADFILTLNVKQLAASDVITKGGAETIKELVKSEPKVNGIFEAAGIDPFKDVDSVLFSGSIGNKAADAKGIVVVKGRFDPDKAFEAAKKKADKVEVLKEDNVSMMKMKIQDHDAFAAFIGKSTLVITQSKEATAALVKNGGKNESKMTTAMKTALGTFKGTETLTFAMVLTDDARAMIKRVPQLAIAAPKMQTITAALNVTSQADLKVVAATSDAKAAAQLKGAANLLKGLGEVMLEADETYGPVISGVLNEVKISTDGNNVHLTLTVDKALLEKANKKKTSDK
jgi:hypothetical protein